MEAFKNLHKECEQIKTSGLSTAEIRRVKKSDKITQPLFRFFVNVSSVFVVFVDSLQHRSCAGQSWWALQVPF